MRTFNGLLNCTALAGAVGVAALLASAPALAAGVADNANPNDEIVVTATKRAESIQVVPESVSAISADKLAELNATRLDDYVAYIPGLSIANSGTPGQTTITLRGIGPVGQSATVGTYIDDTPVGSSTSYAKAGQFELDLFPYDLKQVEVLRGPQGTLYGASAMGGIIKYELKSPDLDHYSAQVGSDISGTSGASDIGWGLRGTVNIPVIKDVLAVSVSGFYQFTPGYINNVGTGVNDSNQLRQYGGRFAALWRPASNVTVKLSALVQRIRSRDDSDETLDVVSIPSANGALLETGSPIHGDLTQSTEIPQPFSRNTEYYSAAVNWDIGFASLISATSYSHTTSDQTNDLSIYDGTVFPYLGPYDPGIAKFDNVLSLKKFTEEVRLQSPAGHTVEWLIGGYYTHESSSNLQLEHAFTFSGTPIDGLGPYLFYASLPTTYEEEAVFGDITVHLTSKFDVTGGIRYSHNSQQYNQIASGAFVGGTEAVSGQSSQGTVTWLANVRYHISTEAMLYARAASGYRPGGPNAIIPGVVTPLTFAADKLINYEAGLKSEMFDRKVTFDLSGFYIDWTNIQLNTLVGGYGYLGNGGKAISKGFELETAFRPVRGFQIGLNAAYSNSKLKDLDAGETAATGYLTGYQLPNVPKFSGALTAEYDWSLSDGWQARLGGDVRYVGKKFSTVVGNVTEAFVLPQYTMFDLNAGVTHGRWSVKLFARNLTDKRAFTSGNILIDANGIAEANFASILQPRTVGVGVDIKL